MSDDPRTTSRLPGDDEYWDALVARSVEAAWRDDIEAEEADEWRASGAGPEEPWWGVLADAGFRLAATALLALAGGYLVLGRTPEPTLPATHSDAISAGLAPEDPMLRALLDDPRAPPPSALLYLAQLRGDR